MVATCFPGNPGKGLQNHSTAVRIPDGLVVVIHNMPKKVKTIRRQHIRSPSTAPSVSIEMNVPGSPEKNETVKARAKKTISSKKTR